MNQVFKNIATSDKIDKTAVAAAIAAAAQSITNDEVRASDVRVICVLNIISRAAFP